MRPAAAAPMVSIGLLLLGFSGCGHSSAATGAPTSPVRGKVTYKGQPLTKGRVIFEPDGKGKQATGEIQPDGTFVLTTYQKDDGAVVGTHRVSIDAPAKVLPIKYGSPNTSKLEVEVAEGKTDPYTFDLR
jgi:hypothetical protein